MWVRHVVAHGSLHRRLRWRAFSSRAAPNPHIAAAQNGASERRRLSIDKLQWGWSAARSDAALLGSASALPPYDNGQSKHLIDDQRELLCRDLLQRIPLFGDIGVQFISAFSASCSPSVVLPANRGSMNRTTPR